MTDYECVKFKSSFFTDHKHPMTLEDSIRWAGAYSGAHKWDFQNKIDETFGGDLSEWTDDDNIGTIVGGELSITGTAAVGSWQSMYHDTQVPPSFLASFDRISGEGAFCFRHNQTTSECFLAWWGTATCGVAYVDSDGVGHDLSTMPYGISTSASRIQVEVKYSLDSLDDERKWLQVGLFADGRYLVGFAKDIGETELDWEGDGVGFGVYHDATFVVDNLTISEIHRIAEWTTIDVGKTPGSGISRVVGTTRLQYMTRYDGTVRVWRPGNRDVDWTAPSGYASIVRMSNRTSAVAPTHARVQAALHEADGFDDTGGEARMHRFIIHNDPNIMTEWETYDETARVLHDFKERKSSVRVRMPPNWTLEPNDRITIDGTDYRVLSIGTVLMKTEGGVEVACQIEAQVYLELSL